MQGEKNSKDIKDSKEIKEIKEVPFNLFNIFKFLKLFKLFIRRRSDQKEMAIRPCYRNREERTISLCKYTII